MIGEGAEAPRVVDTSALAALLFEEPRADEAADLLRGAPLFAPQLLAIELASVASRKALAHPDRREEFLVALRIGLSMDLHWVDVDQPAVVRLALATNLTTYDASYLYVARSLNLPLVTFDEKLRAAM